MPSPTAVQKTIKGLEAFKKRMGLLGVAWSSPVMREAALDLGTRMFFEPSQILCPVDTSRMKESGKIRVTGTGEKTALVITYDTPYAIYVHENPFARHEPPTQWKFVATPIAENKPAFLRGLKGKYLEHFARRKKR